MIKYKYWQVGTVQGRMEQDLGSCSQWVTGRFGRWEILGTSETQRCWRGLQVSCFPAATSGKSILVYTSWPISHWPHGVAGYSHLGNLYSGFVKGQWLLLALWGNCQNFFLQTPSRDLLGLLSLGQLQHRLEKPGPCSLLTCNYVCLNLLACQDCTWSPTCLNKSWTEEARCPVSFTAAVLWLYFLLGADRPSFVIWRNGVHVFLFQSKYGNLLTS